MFAISVPPLSTMYTPFKPPKPIPFTPPYHLVNWWCCCCYCCFFVVKDIDIFFLLTVCSVAFLCTLLSLFNGFYTYFFLPAIVVGSIALRHFHCSLRLKAAFRLYVVVVVVVVLLLALFALVFGTNKQIAIKMLEIYGPLAYIHFVWYDLSETFVRLAFRRHNLCPFTW